MMSTRQFNGLNYRSLHFAANTGFTLLNTMHTDDWYFCCAQFRHQRYGIVMVRTAKPISDLHLEYGFRIG